MLLLLFWLRLLQLIGDKRGIVSGLNNLGFAMISVALAAMGCGLTFHKLRSNLTFPESDPAVANAEEET